ncbi:phage tail assembly chaperone [Pseudoxanthobacter sp.]|uniref:phage tail assembly chaperone n=1 Tax=Pseudoxanthobacter sp. TaxID=1925742 RepID=UPI002FDF329A
MTAPAADPLPWEAAIGFGIGRLGLAPDAFWRLTPRELAAVLRAASGGPGPRAPRRGDLGALMARFPDRRPDRPPDTGG